MTLGRQLLIGLSIIFALLVLGIETIFVQNARRYLQQQLEAHAQETATSLALSLGQGMKAPDAALAETFINPVFDRGHFASIRLLGVDGQTLVVRELGSIRDLDDLSDLPSCCPCPQHTPVVDCARSPHRKGASHGSGSLRRAYRGQPRPLLR